MKTASDITIARQLAQEAAKGIADADAEACECIGRCGSNLIKDSMHILTHCNAGWLAFVDWGSALSPVYMAKRQGKKVTVFVDETRPRCQGALLTAWELQQEGIEHFVIADNAAGFFMKKGDIEIVITGADRIAANGDVANKIGTYEKAVLAYENGIPFYIAAPTTTIDLNCTTGELIPIEERNDLEVLTVVGLTDNNEVIRIRIPHLEAKGRNPAFDVTPAKYITGIITESGIYKPGMIQSIDKK
jgi:methylthioribose-1-phosphate isomerase